MLALEAYHNPGSLPPSRPERLGLLLGLTDGQPLDDLRLAEQIADGLLVSSADAIANIVGDSWVAGKLIPEATLRRARKEQRPLSREMSERLYEISRVIDALGRIYHGDRDAVMRFLTEPHQLLDNQSPLEIARSSSAGSDAVLNLLKRAESGFAV